MFVLEKLDKNCHDRVSFSCAHPILTDYLKCHARKDMESFYCSVYVAVLKDDVEPKKIYGYFTLSTSSISREDLYSAEKYATIPAILIGRLAIQQQQTLLRGYELLAQVLRKCKKVADDIGAKIVLVDAINEKAKRFYIQQGFCEVPSRSMKLFFSLKDIQLSSDRRRASLQNFSELLHTDT